MDEHLKIQMLTEALETIYFIESERINELKAENPNSIIECTILRIAENILKKSGIEVSSISEHTLSTASKFETVGSNGMTKKTIERMPDLLRRLCDDFLEQNKKINEIKGVIESYKLDSDEMIDKIEDVVNPDE